MFVLMYWYDMFFFINRCVVCYGYKDVYKDDNDFEN